ncbi:hypothetical protein ACFE04_012379 [Oxalis oulophora]
MSASDHLSMPNNDGDTALFIAAKVGNLTAAHRINHKDPNLIMVANRDGETPIVVAARHGHKDMVLFLLKRGESALKCVNGDSANKVEVSFMHFLIIARFYDIALKLLKENYAHLATVIFHGGDSPLSEIAAKPSSFPSGMHLTFWQSLQYHFSWTKEMRKKKLIHEETLQLLKFLCEKTIDKDYTTASSLFKRALLSAAPLGIYEVVQEIIMSFPQAIRFTDNENHNMFHLAVLNRQENVFNLIYDMGGYKHLLLVPEDTSGNNILHLAAKLAPKNRLSITPGAALQMQSELQWYKEVERIVQPSFKETRNSNQKTPAELFTEAHSDLVKESEKWMKETASSCSLVAVLIATVVFAAAITVPGGTNQEKGYPLFKRNPAFIVFGISDVLSLFSAIASISMFLSILTARYSEGDFLYVLPNKLICGLVTLFLSISFMIVAFSATIYLVFCEDKLWMLVPIGLLGCFPLTLFMSCQFPLLFSMYSSTYGPGIFGKQKPSRLKDGSIKFVQWLQDYIFNGCKTIYLVGANFFTRMYRRPDIIN